MKQRFVPVSDECADAIRAHRLEWGDDFDAAGAEGVLVAQRVVPTTPRACAKFDTATGDDAPGVTSGGQFGARPHPSEAIDQLLDAG